MTAQQSLRTILFVPGNKPRMLDKARTLPADAVILDLEDGVPPGEKLTARATVCQALKAGSYAPYVILRINAFSTDLAEEDLQQAFSVGVRAVCLPKVEMGSEVEQLASLLTSIEGKWGLPVGAVRIFLMIETALGVLNAYEMACAGCTPYASAARIWPANWGPSAPGRARS
jgi:citrate lyase subunit beta/citryl-CoA lyase